MNFLSVHLQNKISNPSLRPSKLFHGMTTRILSRNLSLFNFPALLGSLNLLIGFGLVHHHKTPFGP
uniref:Uncharacterized protein n=1 Tax=Lotus japonicus TaxID=34305 RepID=I3T2G4_LOTJA|nr:unknown [Lotus japonicus]